MAWSKRKPYHHLKLSMKEFFSKPVRYLKEFYGKESLMDKPYRTDGRPEMHHDIPEYPGFPPWARPRLPEIPRFQKVPPLPGIPDFPPVKFPESRFEQPGVASPWVRPEESMGTPLGRRPGEPAMSPENVWMWSPQCGVQGYIDCLSKGEVGFFNASSEKRKDAVWGIEVSDPDLVSAEIIKLKTRDKIKILVTGLTDPDVAQIVIVCVFMATYKITGYRSVPYPRGSGYDTTHEKKIPIKRMDTVDCGCINITMPCECLGIADPLTWNYAGSIDTIARNGSGTVAVLGGTGPYSWTVSGTGFTLDHSITVGLSNTLNADNTACGSAEITVTDKCGQTVTGYIRETDNSHWQAQAGEVNQCKLAGGTGSWYQSGSPAPLRRRVDVIVGNRKMHVLVNAASSTTGGCPGKTCENANYGSGYTKCSDYCEFKAPVIGCIECATGYNPPGWSVLGPWNCLGRDIVDCGDDTWQYVHCAFTERITNFIWVCD